MTADATAPRSRRSLLTAAAGGAAAAAAATLAKAAPVAAEGETMVVGGEYATATSRTFLKNSTTDSDVLVVTTNGAGKAIWGKSTSGVGVVAESVDDVGLEASGRNFGVKAEAQGTGVTGFSREGIDVTGASREGTGVLASCLDGFGHALRTIGGRVRFDSVSGVATIPPGATEIEVRHGIGMDASSFVLLTPRTRLGGRDLWFTADPTLRRFRIRMSKSRSKPTKVAWLLVG